MSEQLLTERIAQSVNQALKKAQKHGELPVFEAPTIEVSRPKEGAHGDYSTSVAMQSARLARMAPSLIAQAIVKRLPNTDFLGSVEVVPPGFINFRLDDEWLAQQVAVVEAMAGCYGNIDLGHGQRYQVEYISANPTGPLHMGSARNAVLGDAYANLLAAAGYQVQREYYVNDTGTQMRLFGETLYQRYRQALGHDAPLEDAHYKGAYMIDLGRALAERDGDRWLKMPAEDAIAALVKMGFEEMLASIRHSAESLGVHFDNWFSEQSLYDDGTFEKIMASLRAAGLTEFREGAVWLRSSTLGSDRDEVLIRSDGRPGYYASDVAYHYNKFVLRGFDRVLNVWAVDHQNQARRMPYLMKALGLDPAHLTIMLYDFVRLYRNGQEVKLSKRSGDIITIDEVIDEVGADAMRCTLLTRSNQSVMDFDLNLVVAANSENPVYYIQYAHARMSSILREADERGFAAERWAQGDLGLLRHSVELALLRKIVELPEVIERSVLQLAPHNLPFYAIDLAKAFHAFYRDCRVLSAEPADAALSDARLRLVAATKAVFARVLGLMGMTAPESM